MPLTAIIGFFALFAAVRAVDAQTAVAGQLLISEFRLRGRLGALDEYIEIFNNNDVDHTVAATSGTGYGIAASDGLTRCTIPNGTVIPAFGHFLCVNFSGYSLANYPAGPGDVAVGEAGYALDIPDNAGIALFNNNSGGGSYSLANRIDAVGSTSEPNALYKEGSGYPALTPFSFESAWVRDECGKGGANLPGPCTVETPKDTDDNAKDFYFVDVNGVQAGAGQRLGAPGPQNGSSPIYHTGIRPSLVDASVSASSAPNRVRDFTSDPANNATYGTIAIRRRWINDTGRRVRRLRFRVVDITTFPAAPGFADLRPLGYGPDLIMVSGINDAATCAATGSPATPPCTVTVVSSWVEQRVGPNGGGFNSSLTADTAPTLNTDLPTGASVNIEFRLGIQQTGNFRFYVFVEALP